MAERGWGFRYLYLLAWGAVLVLCGKVPAALAVWVVFGVAGVFSHVGGDGRLWVVPGLALGAAVWIRWRTRDWPDWRTGRNLLAGTLGLTVLLGLWGLWSGSGIFFDGKTIRVGREESGEWFLAPDPAVLGMTAGKTIRQRAPAGVALHADALVAQRPRRVVLSGRAVIPEGTVFEQPYNVVWLNPPARLDTASRQVVEQAENAVIVWGGLRTDGHPRELKKWFTALPQAEWREVPGRGLLLESWREDERTEMATGKNHGGFIKTALPEPVGMAR